MREYLDSLLVLLKSIPKSVLYVATVIALLLFIIFAATSCKQDPKPPVTDVISAKQELTADVAKNAINEVSAKKVTTKEAANIVTRIEYVTKHEEPTVSYVVTTASEEKKAKKKIEDLAASEKRDVLIPKEKDDGKRIEYYGITMERKNALGVYADLDSDGSAGAYYRRERVTIAVGEKYKGGITSRVSYDLVKF